MSLRMVAIVSAWLIGASAASAGPLVIGAISHKPTEEIAKFHPLAEHLARSLAPLGIARGKVVVVSSLDELAQLMKSGAADLMFDSPYPTLAVSERSGSKVMLRRWKGGKPNYRSVIVVRAESPLTSAKDLRGKVIAFEASHSTSGYFLPSAALQDAGLALRELAEPRARVRPDEIGYVFSDGYVNSLAWLLHGRTDAAAVGEHDYERFLKREAAQMRIVLETPSVPRNLVSVRGDLAPALVARIRDSLVDLRHTEEGKALLASLDGTTRFDTLPAEDEQALESMRRLLRASAAAATARR